MWFITLLIILDVITLLFMSGNNPESGSPYIVTVIVLYFATVMLVIVCHTVKEFRWSRSLVKKAIRGVRTCISKRNDHVEFDSLIIK